MDEGDAGPVGCSPYPLGPDHARDAMRKQGLARDLPLDRFFKRIKKTRFCWLWTGYISPAGYGSYTIARKYYRVHRLAWELGAKRKIPRGLHIDHLCRVRHCVNPKHLEVVTQTENNRRGYGFSGLNFRKTHCCNGHPFIGANLHVRKDGQRVQRVCQTCMRRASRDYMRRKRASQRKAHWTQVTQEGTDG